MSERKYVDPLTGVGHPQDGCETPATDDLTQRIAVALNRPCRHTTVTKPKYLGIVQLKTCDECLPAAMRDAIEAGAVCRRDSCTGSPASWDECPACADTGVDKARLKAALAALEGAKDG